MPWGLTACPEGGTRGEEGKAEDGKQQSASVQDRLQVMWMPMRMGHCNGDRLRRGEMVFLNLSASSEVPALSALENNSTRYVAACLCCHRVQRATACSEP